MFMYMFYIAIDFAINVKHCSPRLWGMGISDAIFATYIKGDEMEPASFIIFISNL